MTTHQSSRCWQIILPERDLQSFPLKTVQSALSLYHSLHPDIVLVDLKMPGLDGFQVLQTVRADSPDTPIIVVSGEGERADVIQALRLGAWDYHIKSIDNFAFIEHSVQQALDKARLIRENKAYQHGLENKLFTVIENFDGFIFTIDQNFRLTYMNPALVTHLGRDATGEKCHKSLFGTMTRTLPSHAGRPWAKRQRAPTTLPWLMLISRMATGWILSSRSENFRRTLK
jgi:CheY-like chemotaxis protein